MTPQSYTAASLTDLGYLNVSVTGCTISTSFTRSSGAVFDPWTYAAPTCSSGPATGELFADGFETGDFSAWTTVQVGVGGSATVQSSTVKAGQYSAALSATTTAGSYAYARKNLATAQLEVAASGDFRVVSEGVSGANVPLIRLYNETGTRILSLYRQNASGSKLYVQHSGLYNTTTGVLPLNTWGRLEVKVKVNGSASSVEVRLNGALVHQTSSANLGGSGVFRIQIGNDTTSQAFSLVADDISVTDGSAPSPSPSPSASPSPSPSPPEPVAEPECLAVRQPERFALREPIGLALPLAELEPEWRHAPVRWLRERRAQRVDRPDGCRRCRHRSVRDGEVRRVRCPHLGDRCRRLVRIYPRVTR